MPPAVYTFTLRTERQAVLVFPPETLNFEGMITVFERTNHLSISSNRPGQLSLLPSTGWVKSTGRSAVKLCGCGVKAGWLIPYVDKRVGGR